MSDRRLEELLAKYVHEHVVHGRRPDPAELCVDDPELLESLTDPSYGEVPERAIRFRIEAWDKNCRKHIPQLAPANP